MTIKKHNKPMGLTLSGYRYYGMSKWDLVREAMDDGTIWIRNRDWNTTESVVFNKTMSRWINRRGEIFRDDYVRD